MKRNPGREMLHGVSDLVVLAMLGRRPMHGYGIRQGAIRLSHGRIAPGTGNIYRLLTLLERRRWIRGTDIITGHARWKRVYSITEAGRNEADRRRLEWEGFASGMAGVLDGRTTRERR